MGVSAPGKKAVKASISYNQLGIVVVRPIKRAPGTVGMFRMAEPGHTQKGKGEGAAAGKKKSNNKKDKKKKKGGGAAAAAAAAAAVSSGPRDCDSDRDVLELLGSGDDLPKTWSPDLTTGAPMACVFVVVVWVRL